QPAHLGEHKVEDDEVGFALTEHLEGLLAVGSRDDLMAVTPQIEAHDLADVGLVVDDKDLRHVNLRLSAGRARASAPGPAGSRSRDPRPGSKDNRRRNRAS